MHLMCINLLLLAQRRLNKFFCFFFTAVRVKKPGENGLKVNSSAGAGDRLSSSRRRGAPPDGNCTSRVLLRH
ncbi:hypothetical protein BTJ39_16030 [Izhakiella australiensis]|uniref:Uncharacterized protein n=1 Tax=Izhakiella australiensis TaxID=1926881 RepID=A0A1S8YIH7_9GAMM|nr:hypothetical protein BTJ39_16030 [Izhakiella australiensis]